MSLIKTLAENTNNNKIKQIMKKVNRLNRRQFRKLLIYIICNRFLNDVEYWLKYERK